MKVGGGFATRTGFIKLWSQSKTLNLDFFPSAMVATVFPDGAKGGTCFLDTSDACYVKWIKAKNNF